MDFVVSAGGDLAPVGPDGLSEALRAAGIGPGGRVVAVVQPTEAAVRDLTARLRELAAVGASELVVVASPSDLSRAGELLEAALAEGGSIDVSLVGADDPTPLLEPGTLLLRPVPADVPTLFYGSGSNGADESVLQQAPEKYEAEIGFWREILDRWVEWYQGTGLPGYPPPSPEEKVTEFDLRTNAAVTFSRIYQEAKYLTDLALHAKAFLGMRVLDVGCGPAASMLAFRGADLHGLDPLVDAYREAGFPLEVWSRMGYTYHCAAAEAMPFADGWFDAVVSVNAIDHIDDFGAGAREVRRVLKPDGVFRMHVHYHPATRTEPLELNDEVFLEHYGWVPGLRKIVTSDTKDSGMTRAEPGELYVLWGNT